jgi:hypothetical protein
VHPNFEDFGCGYRLDCVPVCLISRTPRETIITLTANGFVSIPDSHFFLSLNDDPALGHTAPVSAATPRNIPRSKARPDFPPI